MTAVAVVLMRDLFAVVMLTGIYSLLSASFLFKSNLFIFQDSLLFLGSLLDATL